MTNRQTLDKQKPNIGDAPGSNGILTVHEASLLMRCSKAHLHSVIQGRVQNVAPLPCIRIGRRIVIRRESLERWMAAIESQAGVRA